MTEISHAPLNLPAGSFELSEVRKVADEVSKAPEDKRTSLAAEKLDEINKRSDKVEEANALPGHKTRSRTTTLAGEGDAAVKVTETIQVFDPAKAEEEAQAAEEATAAGEGTTAAADGQRGETRTGTASRTKE
jgi:hypothetical protein